MTVTAKTIVQDGDPVLRHTALEIPDDMFGTSELQALVTEMTEILDSQQDGVAIAAPQIGISSRIFVVRYDRLHTSPADSPLPVDVGVYINPEFVKASRRREEMEEGCLSVRGTYGKTYRHQRSTVRARTVDGSTFERGAGGVLSQVFQHEIDHLNGILFIDHAIEKYEIKKDKEGWPEITNV